MYQHSRLNSDLNFFQKIKNLDFILLFCIIILSTLSFFIMYSTDGGELLYHSKSHLTKLITFFILYFIGTDFVSTAAISSVKFSTIFENGSIKIE